MCIFTIFCYKVYGYKAIGNYIGDFYCPKLKLSIEVDGREHYTEKGKNYDKRRTEELGKFGVRVIRFSNIDFLKNLGGV